MSGTTHSRAVVAMSLGDLAWRWKPGVTAIPAALSFAFPLIAHWDGTLLFRGFAAATLLQALLVWRLFPKTRGRDLEAISADLMKRTIA